MRPRCFRRTAGMELKDGTRNDAQRSISMGHRLLLIIFLLSVMKALHSSFGRSKNPSPVWKLCVSKHIGLRLNETTAISLDCSIHDYIASFAVRQCE